MATFDSMSSIQLWEGACRGFSAETGYEWFEPNDLDDVEPNVIAFGGALEAINDTIYMAHATAEDDDELYEPIADWRGAFAAFFARHPRYLSRDLVKCARRVDLHLTPVL